MHVAERQTVTTRLVEALRDTYQSSASYADNTLACAACTAWPARPCCCPAGLLHGLLPGASAKRAPAVPAIINAPVPAIVLPCALRLADVLEQLALHAGAGGRWVSGWPAAGMHEGMWNVTILNGMDG